METATTLELYERFLAINREAFDAGNFDATYYALAGALNCAQSFQADDAIQNVIHIITEQLAWIDEHHPEYNHSTQSTVARGKKMSIFTILANHGKIVLKLRKSAAQRNLYIIKETDL